MDIDFRRLTEADLPRFSEIRNLCCEEFLHNPQKFSLEETKEWFSTLDEESYMGIFISDPPATEVLAGYFRLNVLDTSLTKHVDIGADLHPDFRGQGLAHTCYCLIMNEFKQEAKDAGQRSVCFCLSVLGSNTRAYNLYRKLGFNPVRLDEIERLGRKEPSIYMIKRVSW